MTFLLLLMTISTHLLIWNSDSHNTVLKNTEEKVEITMNMTDKEAIYNKYQELYEAMIKKDTAHLDEILDSDYHLIHMTGYDQTKAEWLDEIDTENMRYFKQTEDSVTIDNDGDTAKMVTRNCVDARIYGSRHTWRLQLSHGLEKRNGEWIFTHTVAKMY